MLELKGQLDLKERLATLAGSPTILSVTDGAETANIRMHIVDDLSWFRGHFPNLPVLPGIVQLHWAVQACEILFGLKHPPVEIKRLKFKRVITPPRLVELNLLRKGERAVQFSFNSRDEAHSEGRLIFPETTT